MFEYVVCLARDRSCAPSFSVEATTAGKKYPLNNAGNSIGVLTFPPGSVRFSCKSIVYEPQDMSEGNISTRLLDRVSVNEHLNVDAFRLEGEFRYGQSRLDEIVRNGEVITISKAPFRPNHVKAGGEIKKMHNLLTPETYRAGTNEDGSSELEGLFGASLFDNPKPSSLVRILCQAVTYDDPDAIVVDFFSGSATTAHAVLQLNAEDGGNRRFIMVQIPAPCNEESEAFKAGYRTISELGMERIRRAGQKLKAEYTTRASLLDIGFRVLKVDSSNMKDVYYAPDDVKQGLLLDQIENTKEDRVSEDLLFQVLLDWGVDLSLPITCEIVEGKTVFFVDGNALVACFDNDINEQLVKTLATRKPLRAVFRDSGFGSDSVKISVEQIFKLMSPSTEVKAI